MQNRWTPRKEESICNSQNLSKLLQKPLGGNDLGESLVIVHGNESDRRLVHRLVVSTGAVIVAHVNDLVECDPLLLGILGESVKLIVRTGSHVKRGGAAHENVVIGEDLTNIRINSATAASVGVKL